MMSSCIECSRNKSSGKDVVWPQLEALLAFVRDGDTVVVHSMDRLARNLDDLRRLVRAMTGKGVRVQFVTQNLTFTSENTAMAKLLLSVMGAFAEFERALIRERTREGMAVARAKGRLKGRRPKLSAKQQTELRRMHGTGDYTITDLAELVQHLATPRG
jgi:DNA invertase Pin-like site-specific DNA recombinase